MDIIQDDLENEDVITLLKQHLLDMYATSPPESVHALDVAALKSSNITFFSAWINGTLAGCIAINHLDSDNAEIKSMRTANPFRHQGVASQLLTFILNFARQKGYKTVSLETGTQDYFLPARNLYKKYGFIACGPFADYELDPNSYFMSRNV